LGAGAKREDNSGGGEWGGEDFVTGRTARGGKRDDSGERDTDGAPKKKKDSAEKKGGGLQGVVLRSLLGGGEVRFW